MTENREIRVKALELAIRYCGRRESLTAGELSDIKGVIERELTPIAKAFESLITGELLEWGPLR
jgi:hypothetical protein